MKVALIGASGNVRSRILAELLNRGHEATGIVRHPEKLRPREGLTAEPCDINDESRISFDDYATALVDELETPRHSRQRFTVG